MEDIYIIGLWPHWVRFENGKPAWAISYNTGGWYKCGRLYWDKQLECWDLHAWKKFQGFDKAMQWLGDR